MRLRTLILTLLSTTYAIQSYANPETQSAESSTVKTVTSDDKIILNFENADIQAVIKAISKLSGKNFVIDPRVKGTVNIVSEKPVSKSESYKVLESALRMQGFATVEADGVIKVLPEADAKTYAMRSEISGSNQGDQLITKVFTIENGSATQISNAIRPIVSQNNSISVYPNSNALIVTDYASNLARVSKIIDSLNATAKTKLPPVIIKLKYLYASDAAQTLQSYLGTGNAGGASGGNSSSGASDSGPAINITVDSSSNSLILTSNSQTKLDEIKKLAQTLDTETKNNNSNLHVVYLKNADAAHVAEVLRVIASGQDNPDMSASPSQRYLSDTSSMMSNGGTSGSGGSGGGMPSSGGGSSAPKSSGSSSSSQASGGDKNAPKILIQAEPTTNSLIIQAPEAVYRNFRSIIDMLDVRRVQVMIEALIADINTKNQGSFGIQWVGGAGNNNAGIGMISNYGGNGSSLSSLAATAMGLANPSTGSQLGGSGLPNEVYVGLVTGTVQIGGQTIPGISTLANMIAATSAGNILGRPTLLTLDNEEASIFVGMNIGLPSGSYASTGNNNSVTPFTTVNRQDVGTALKLKPLVTQSGAIQLSVFQEDSKVDPNMPTGVYANNGANLLKRNMKTQIIVNDGQIIALGGMTSDSITLQNSGIPLLSSIPYLGWLFSWQNRIHEKTNLVIFLKPTIIRNEEGMRALTNQRYRYILDQQKAIHAEGNLLLPRIDAVTLENQVPYTDKLPTQSPEQYDGNIVDLRTGQENTTKVENQATNTDATSNNSGLVVKQTAPNAITITPSTQQ